MIKKELINQSIDYIIQHFDENLAIEDVANHFHFSKFYFCRSFKEVTGESVYAFIKRLKMDQSAIYIRESEGGGFVLQGRSSLSAVFVLSLPYTCGRGEVGDKNMVPVYHGIQQSPF